MYLSFARAERRLRRLGTLCAVMCVSGTVIALGGSSDNDSEAAAKQPEQHRTSPTPTAETTADVAAKVSPDPVTSQPSKEATESGKESAPSMTGSASCIGTAKDMRFSAAGGTVTDSSSPRPGYLEIKKASVTRNSNHVTITYTVASAAPQPGSYIQDANYFTWLGTGSAEDGAVDLLYLGSQWTVSVIGAGLESGGDVRFQPEVQGNRLSITLPLRVPTNSGDEIDLSAFTHAGWSTSGKDPSGFGTWTHGCPTDGNSAGNPGSWEVRLH